MRSRPRIGLAVGFARCWGGADEVFAQGKLWDKRYPDTNPVMGAPDRPAGVFGRRNAALSTGSRFTSATNSAFYFVRQSVGGPTGAAGGQIVDTFQWPITGSRRVRTAICSTFLPSTVNQYAAIGVVAGTTANDLGFLRPAMVAVQIDTFPSTGTFTLLGSAQEALTLNEDRLPVAVETDGEFIAIAATGNGHSTDVGAYLMVYDMSGAKIVESKFDTAGDDVPVAVGFVTTSAGQRAAYLVLTTPSIVTPGATQMAVHGWVVSESGPWLRGTELGTLYVPQNPGDSDEARDAATASATSVAVGLVAGTGTRSKGGSETAKDYVTFLAMPTAVTGQPDAFSVQWVDLWDMHQQTPPQVEDTDDAKAILVYDASGSGQSDTLGSIRVAVTGTTSPVGGVKTVGTIVYTGFGERKWFGHWNDAHPTYTGDRVPMSMAWGRLGPSSVPLLFISAYAEKAGGNRDYACMGYYTSLFLPEFGRVPEFWNDLGEFYSAAWGTVDGRDEARFIWTGNIEAAAPNHVKGTIFVNGVSEHAVSGDDWVVMRIESGEP